MCTHKKKEKLERMKTRKKTRKMKIKEKKKKVGITFHVNYILI